MAIINTNPIGLSNKTSIDISISSVKSDGSNNKPLSQEGEIVLSRFMENFVATYCEHVRINDVILESLLVGAVKNTLGIVEEVIAFSIVREDEKIDKGV